MAARRPTPDAYATRAGSDREAEGSVDHSRAVFSRRVAEAHFARKGHVEHRHKERENRNRIALIWWPPAPKCLRSARVYDVGPSLSPVAPQGSMFYRNGIWKGIIFIM